MYLVLSATDQAKAAREPREAGAGKATPLYKLYRYVPPNRVGFLRRFGLKYTLPILVWNREWFSRNYGVYEHISRFNSK